jgi:hypothetical protein
MARTRTQGQAPVEGLEQHCSASLVEAIDGLREAVALLAERLAPPEPPPSPFRGSGCHLRAVPPAGPGDTPWERLSVPELRALLREVPIDRSSLPAPIENLRRAELVETLRQVQALQNGGVAP